jgi:hypothetical protein
MKKAQNAVVNAERILLALSITFLIFYFTKPPTSITHHT